MREAQRHDDQSQAILERKLHKIQRDVTRPETLAQRSPQTLEKTEARYEKVIQRLQEMEAQHEQASRQLISIRAQCLQENEKLRAINKEFQQSNQQLNAVEVRCQTKTEQLDAAEAQCQQETQKLHGLRAQCESEYQQLLWLKAQCQQEIIHLDDRKAQFEQQTQTMPVAHWCWRSDSAETGSDLTFSWHHFDPDVSAQLEITYKGWLEGGPGNASYSIHHTTYDLDFVTMLQARGLHRGFHLIPCVVAERCSSATFIDKVATGRARVVENIHSLRPRAFLVLIGPATYSS